MSSWSFLGTLPPAFFVPLLNVHWEPDKGRWHQSASNHRWRVPQTSLGCSFSTCEPGIPCALSPPRGPRELTVSEARERQTQEASALLPGRMESLSYGTQGRGRRGKDKFNVVQPGPGPSLPQGHPHTGMDCRRWTASTATHTHTFQDLHS